MMKRALLSVAVATAFAACAGSRPAETETSPSPPPKSAATPAPPANPPATTLEETTPPALPTRTEETSPAPPPTVEETPPAHCGGRSRHRCAPTEFCAFGSTTCDMADQSGVCRPFPASCGADDPVVCSCGGGATFANACEAQRAGVRKLAVAGCPAP